MWTGKDSFHWSGRVGLFAAVLSLELCFSYAWAAPVNQGQAGKMVREWLKADPRPMGSRLGNQIDGIDTFRDSQNQPLYFVVYLKPNGFVIVPAEDTVEPVIAFSSSGSFDPSPGNPLGALVSRDLPGRVSSVRTVERKNRSAFSDNDKLLMNSSQKAFGKWKKFLSYDANEPEIKMGIGGISDVRVAPLLQTRWGQNISCYNPALACFNYYTPPYGDNNPDNYYAGCVATAMAQFMYFHQYPSSSVGTPCFTIEIGEEYPPNYETACLRGGDGYGGAYHWTTMVLDPGCGTSQAQREAIGALLYDAGVAVEMQYTSNWSGANLYSATVAMINTFDYSNAVFGWNNNNEIGSGRTAMINTNLDWGNPVILGIDGDGGHAVVADGYGYNSSTLYHHVNLGWDGSDDAWYNLPIIDTSYYYFNSVDGVIYNIYITGSGEIISGRVTDSGSGAPIAGAAVTAVRSGGGTYPAITNAQGIYALAKVPSNSSYTITVTKAGYTFSSPQVISTTRSDNYEEVSGNRWGINFTGSLNNPVPPVASDSSISVDQGQSSPVILQAADDGQPAPPGALSFIITSLPQHGSLSDPNAGSITVVPYTIVNNGRTVTYSSGACYAGPDSFQFKANDGGSAPFGGDSNTATVGITIESAPMPVVAYETHFNSGLPAGWSIVHGGSTSQSWQSDNPNGYESPYWAGVFMLVESAAEAGNMDEELITQSIDCTNLSDIRLRFKHKFEWWGAGYGEIGDVDIRLNGGSWQNITRYEGSNFEGLIELDLSVYGADDIPDVQVRWHYYNTDWEWYWGIDDVEIVAVSSAPPSQLVGDFEGADCDVDYLDLDTFVNAWLTSSGQENWNPACDLDDSDVIDMLDFAPFAQNWLSGVY